MQKVFSSAVADTTTFKAGKGGFDIGVAMSDSAVITVQQKLGVTWHALGATFAATGRKHYSADVDYAAGSTIRLNCTTFVAAAVTVDVEGDIVV